MGMMLINQIAMTAKVVDMEMKDLQAGFQSEVDEHVECRSMWRRGCSTLSERTLG